MPFYNKYFTLYIAFGLLLASFLGIGCGSSSAKKERLPKTADHTITTENAFADIYVDSTRIVQFIGEKQLSQTDSIDIMDFYRQRRFQFAWFDSTGIAEQAGNFVNLYRNYASSVADSLVANAALDSLVDKLLATEHKSKIANDEMEEVELMLTQQFFRYANRAYGGNSSIDLPDLGWFIPRKKMDAASFLDSVIVSGGRDLMKHLPVHPFFEDLRKQLVHYTALQKQGNWDSIPFVKPKYQLGDFAPEVTLIKQRLQLLGDLPATDTGALITDTTVAGIKQFQARMGLATDGVAGKGFFEELNLPLEKRMQQILVNMERARWVPKPGKGPYVMVNIPEFKLHVYDSGRQQFTMPVVVGKPATNTVIFTGTMQFVVLAPYWNVPYSIVKNEMGRTASYFSRRNMEIVGRYSDGLPIVRQKPGPSNALGKVKLLFPNSYSIYLHDTPSKGLFGQEKRAFSHGCIRVAQPEKLAAWALRFNPEWPLEKMREAMNGNKEIIVTMKKPVPVFVGYFTSWVDENGKLNFRKDIYHHDKKMAEHLFPVKN